MNEAPGYRSGRGSRKVGSTADAGLWPSSENTAARELGEGRYNGESELGREGMEKGKG